MLSGAKGFMREGDFQDFVKQRSRQMGYDDDEEGLVGEHRLASTFKPITGSLPKVD